MKNITINQTLNMKNTKINQTGDYGRKQTLNQQKKQEKKGLEHMEVSIERILGF